MKIIKNILNIILICIIIQVISMVCTNTKVYASGDSFILKSLEQAKNSSTIARNNAISILEKEGSGLTSGVGEIINALRILGAVVLLVKITLLFVELAQFQGAHIPSAKANAKLRIGIMIVLVIMFLFADTIIDFFKTLIDYFIS